MGPNYLQQAFSVLGYSAQSLEHGTDPEKIAKHIRSELDRLKMNSDIGKTFLNFEVPEGLFREKKNS